MNPDLEKLQPYPFEKLAQLKADLIPPGDKSAITLSIGEPQDPAPAFALDAYRSNAEGLMKYPNTKGTLELREAICQWLSQRFSIPGSNLNPEKHVLPVNGTREALFAFAQSIIDRNKPADVLMPNPFYQIYEGAALLAGAQPRFLPCLRENGYLPDFESVSAEQWQRCQLIYICSPGNPTGAVIPLETLKLLIEKARQYDFVIASDECYSEIYASDETPPPGLLQAAEQMGNTGFDRCVVFHSLSKRSNLPGLRSGFVAGDARLLGEFFRYRTYHGCAMPLQSQKVSEAAWSDETHVRLNRQRYREKFEAVLPILQPYLNVSQPEAGFYLWPETPIADDQFAAGLFATENLTILPGSYLSRTIDGANPGSGHVRIALVPSLADCIEAAQRIRRYCESL